MLGNVPDQYKRQEMCDTAVREDPFFFQGVSDWFVTQEMCNKAVRIEPCMLDDVRDHFKTQEMYSEAVRIEPDFLCYLFAIYLKLTVTIYEKLPKKM